MGRRCEHAEAQDCGRHEVVNERPDTAPAVDELLTRFLSDRDARCPLCSYNLRGLTGSHCPECGREIQLAIRVTERVYAPWLVSFAAAAFSGPFGFLFIFAALTGAAPFWSVVDWIFGLTAITMMIIIGVLVATRKRMLRASSGLKRAIAVGCVAGSATVWAFALVSIVRSL